MIGEEILPSAVVPLTSVPTFLSWGPQRRIKIGFLDGREEQSRFENAEGASEFLSQYVTESQNPKNHLGVNLVEVEHPSLLLKKGVVLIDTPGIGSTFQHNTESTLNFLPQCDAALFLVSADPPITQVEIEFLKAVRDKVVRTLFLMNKVDYLSDEERQQAVDFFKTVLREQIGLDGEEPVFSVSARLGLESKLKGNDSLWAESGMSELEDYLLKFLSEEKIQTLSMAIARKAGDVLGDGLLHLRLKQRSLTLPVEDLEHRLAVFDQKLKEIDQQRLRARDVLEDEVIRDAKEIKAIQPTVRARLAEAIPDFFNTQMTETLEYMDEQIQGAFNAQQEVANDLTNAVRQTATELFEMPYIPAKYTEGFEMNEKPYWVTEHWSVPMTPIPRGSFERLLPRNMAVKRIKKWLQEDLEAITSRNVEQLRWHTLQKINDTFQRFILNLDKQLEEVSKATLGAIQEAHRQRQQKSGNLSTELSRLASFESQILELQSKLRAAGQPIYPAKTSLQDRGHNCPPS